MTRAKWVFVPPHAIGRTLGERLALEGTNWINLRFVTPLDIALGMGAPFLVERGIDPSEEGLGPALVMRLMLEQQEEQEKGTDPVFAGPLSAGYFRPLAGAAGVAGGGGRRIRCRPVKRKSGQAARPRSVAVHQLRALHPAARLPRVRTAGRRHAGAPGKQDRSRSAGGCPDVRAIHGG